jgi:hypothetical protein
MPLSNVDRHCKAKAKSGKRCKAAATDGGLCFFHANPNKASELGRIGGRSKRHIPAENAEPLARLDNGIAVRDTVDRLIAGVYSGKVQPRIAASLAPLLNLQMRAIEASDLERRLAELEKRLAEIDPEGGLHETEHPLYLPPSPKPE